MISSVTRSIQEGIDHLLKQVSLVRNGATATTAFYQDRELDLRTCQFGHHAMVQDIPGGILHVGVGADNGSICPTGNTTKNLRKSYTVASFFV